MQKKHQLILVYSEKNKKKGKLTLTSTCVLVSFEAFWASFEKCSYPSLKEDSWKLANFEATDHSAIEDDLIPKIGLIRPFFHSHMKIDNKRYSIKA